MGVVVKKNWYSIHEFSFIYNQKLSPWWLMMTTMVKMFELVPHSLKLFILRVKKFFFLVYAVFYILSYVFCSVLYSLKMERDVLKKNIKKNPPSYWLAAHNDCTHPTYSVLLLLLLLISLLLLLWIQLIEIVTCYTKNRLSPDTGNYWFSIPHYSITKQYLYIYEFFRSCI